VNGSDFGVCFGIIVIRLFFLLSGERRPTIEAGRFLKMEGGDGDGLTGLLLTSRFLIMSFKSTTNFENFDSCSGETPNFEYSSADN
jgi:hypothetical protein